MKCWSVMHALFSTFNTKMFSKWFLHFLYVWWTPFLSKIHFWSFYLVSKCIMYQFLSLTLWGIRKPHFGIFNGYMLYHFLSLALLITRPKFSHSTVDILANGYRQACRHKDDSCSVIMIARDEWMHHSHVRCAVYRDWCKKNGTGKKIGH